MIFSRLEHTILPRIIVPLLAAVLLISASQSSVQAAERNTFVIVDSEGYGIMDCLTSGKACGRVVADAWCEAHGMGQALAFGKSDDVTGSTQPTPATATAAAVKPGSVVVTCDN